MTDEPKLSEQKANPFDLKWTLEACPHDAPPDVVTKMSRFGYIFIFASMLVLFIVYIPLMPLAFIGLIFRDKFIYCSQCGKFLEVKPKFRIQGLPKFYKQYYG